MAAACAPREAQLLELGHEELSWLPGGGAVLEAPAVADGEAAEVLALADFRFSDKRIVLFELDKGAHSPAVDAYACSRSMIAERIQW